MLLQQCLYCGNDFQAQPSRKKKFCSLRCSGFAQPSTTIPPEIRFWKLVDKGTTPDSCWFWLGAKSKKRGYGMFGFDAEHTVTAHRQAWIFTNGPIKDGLDVCHDCPDGQNHPDCCNPAHMFLGTRSENMRDAVRKQRVKIGQESHLAKVTDTQVLIIRKLYNEGSTQRNLAKQFNVSIGCIQNIVDGKSWTWLLPKGWKWKPRKKIRRSRVNQ